MSFTVIITGMFAGRVLQEASSLGRQEKYSDLWTFALAGTCLAGVLLLAVGSLSLFYSRALTIGIAVAGVWYLFIRRDPLASGEDNVTDSSARNWLETSNAAVVILVLIAAFLATAAPITGWDASVAHGALPKAYNQANRILLVDGNNYSGYPQLVHSLFAVAMKPDRPQSLSLVAWFLSVLACGVAFDLAKRLAGREAGYIAAAILATAPIFFDQATAPSIDLAYTATVLGAINACVAWRQERNIRWLVLAGLLAGSGCGIRHTAYLAGPLLLAFVLWDSHATRAKAGAVFAGTAAAAALPWVIRTWLVTGNPFYPFFASIFPTPGMPDVDVAMVGTHSSLQGRSLLDLALFPWNLVMQPERYGGWATSPGALVLALGVPGLFVGGREARRIGAFCLTGLVCLFFFQRFARYALPFLAPMMVVAAIAAVRIPSLKKPIAALLVVSYAFGLVPAVAAVATKLPVVLGRETRDAYLRARVERYDAFEWVNANLDRESTILTLDPRGFYFDLPVYQNFEALKPLVGLRTEEQFDWLTQHKVRYLFYPEAYVLESPAFRENGILDMVNAWRADETHFRLLQRMLTKRPRAPGMETVEVYELAGE